MPEQVFAHYDQRQAGGAEVLLGAAERDTHARPVHTARGHVGGEVDDQRCIAAQALEVRQFMKLHTVDGFIAAQVHIAGALAQLPR